MVHFLHDLESVYWQYIWFLHNRIPVEKLSTTSLENVQQQAKLYFGHNVHGSRDRFKVIRNHGSDMVIRSSLTPMHSRRYLSPISFAGQLRGEYTRVLKKLPNQIGDTWRLGNVFNEEIYRNFHGMLQHILRTETAPYPVVPIESANDHTRTKKRKLQPSEPDAPTNKKQKLRSSKPDAPSNTKRKLRSSEPDASTNKKQLS